MTQMIVESKQRFLSQLFKELSARLDKGKAEILAGFARQFYAGSPLEDLQEARLVDMYGATLFIWEFVQQFDSKGPKIRLFNPDFEQHGWQSSHTVLEVLNINMPFLVDSIRMEFNRRDINIHVIHNAVLDVDRDNNGCLLSLQDKDQALPGEQELSRESLIYMELDRHDDEQQLADYKEAILTVLEEVKLTVEDFGKMKDQLELIATEAEQQTNNRDPEAIGESCEFLRWLPSFHFTFLGYCEFSYEQQDNRLSIVPVKDSELGMFRKPAFQAKVLELDNLPQDAAKLLLSPELLIFSRSSLHSNVHRPAYYDYVSVKKYDKAGNVIGEYRFMGHYTSNVYTQSARRIPVLRNKINAVISRSGFEPAGHDGKELLLILNGLAREELFLSTVRELYEVALAILHIQERRKVKLFIRKDTFSKFYSCLVYTPRDIYCTTVRIKVENILCEALHVIESEFRTTFSESILARTHFLLRVDPAVEVNFDIGKLEKEIIDAIRPWHDELMESLVEICGEEQGIALGNAYGHAFSVSYIEDFSPPTAVADIQHIEELQNENTLGMSFYRSVAETGQIFRFKLFHMQQPLPLSDVLPILEKLGLRVIGAKPYEVKRHDKVTIWVHDFSLVYCLSDDIDLNRVKTIFQDAFANIWHGNAENDGFNRLILGTGLSWREVAILRAYAHYIKQIRFGFSQQYIADTLCRHLTITRLLARLFTLHFDPSLSMEDEQRSADIKELEDTIAGMLDKVENLNEDRILRRYMEIMRATLRTNCFQKDQQGNLKNYFSFKISPPDIPNIPKPVPMFEIFVYSPRIEGVHLRGGKVARGGLRWSDRNEDFRTEVLGLVKAQQVKNAVIVPVGAKGGFIAKQLPENATREQIQNEGIACYRTFISSLLDITDNIVDGEIVPPTGVIRKDSDDPYLVVAADKGTATFSDIANTIAAEYGFWLGDAFASGGSVGYDHKKMGITAKGAWRSVQRHFRELGINVQKNDFTVIGIGDMAGDVFGNGMLLSEHIRLVAAFNHMHIFVDPEPNAAACYQERKRLFALPRSSWLDYDTQLISKGGGIFSRASKFINITDEMKKRFGITQKRLSPNELINIILKTPVDLLWNGGIGTYVKSTSESHADTGDKANDVLRINGEQLQCRVVGEGGNLGLTQLGRVEYSLNGGISCTDFIDNAGGVDCSDHEVNIKILLNQLVSNGDMTIKQRNKLLADMTDEVAELVLHNNYRQVQSIAIAREEAHKRFGEYRRLICSMEESGRLDRKLEFIPDDDELTERELRGIGLTMPELSVLNCYVKGELKEELTNSNIQDDELVSQAVETAFPRVLATKFPHEMHSHSLRKEIIATQVSNNMVNQMGITYVHRLKDSTGSDTCDIARAYMTCSYVFGLEDLWQQVESLDYKVTAELQNRLMLDLMRFIRRASRWFLRNRRQRISVKNEVEHFKPAVTEVIGSLSELLYGSSHEEWFEDKEKYLAEGIPEQLASIVAGIKSLYSILGIVEVSRQTATPVKKVAEAYFVLSDRLSLHWLAVELNNIKVKNHWQELAREAFLDDLTWQQRALTASLLECDKQFNNINDSIEEWLHINRKLAGRWGKLLVELRNNSGTGEDEFSVFSVALRELLDLAQGSMHCQSDADD